MDNSYRSIDMHHKRTEFTRKLAELKPQNFYRTEFEMFLPLTDFVLDANGASLKLIDRKLVVTSQPKQWAFMAYAPISYLLPICDRVTLVIKAIVTVGIVGFGISKKSNKIVVEKAVSADPDEQEIILQPLKLKRDSYLIIRTWAEDGQTSSAIIKNIKIINNKSVS